LFSFLVDVVLVAVVLAGAFEVGVVVGLWGGGEAGLLRKERYLQELGHERRG